MKEAIKNVNTEQINYVQTLKNKFKGTMDNGYRMEFDVSMELGPDQDNY